MVYYKSLVTITEIPDGWRFHCVNSMNGKHSKFDLDAESCFNRDVTRDAEAWRDGKLIQDAFPYLTPAERELLITGMLPEDWENMDDLGE